MHSSVELKMLRKHVDTKSETILYTVEQQIM